MILSSSTVGSRVHRSSAVRASVSRPCPPVRRLAGNVSCVAAKPCTQEAYLASRIHPEIGKVLYTEAQIFERLEALGKEIGTHYSGKPLVVVGVLKGGFMFTSDLIKHIQPFPPVFEVDFLKASSYGSSTSTSGTVKIDDQFDMSIIRGKHVLLVEDIVDTGLTLTKVVEKIKEEGPLSVKICALLDKEARRKVPLEANYVGFKCPDEFVVGYGIDYAERYRYLPYVGVPKPEFVKS